MSHDLKRADIELIACLVIALVIVLFHFSLGTGLAMSFLVIRVGRMI